MRARRVPGAGRLVLIGGGEFSFGETEHLDRAWLAGVEGEVAFLPTASNSNEYGDHFTTYVAELLATGGEAEAPAADTTRETAKTPVKATVKTVPVYRPRDARRAKNGSRIDEAAAVYLGGGVGDRLLDVLEGSPVLDALQRKLSDPTGTIVAIAAAAQAVGEMLRSMFGGRPIRGLGWLPGGAVETNFTPTHDRRLRQLLAVDGIRWGIGLPAGSAVILGPEDAVETLGPVWGLRGPDDDLVTLGGEPLDTQEQ